MDKLFESLAFSLDNRQMVAAATVISGSNLGKKMLVWPDGRIMGDLGQPILEKHVLEKTPGLFTLQSSAQHSFTIEGQEFIVFIDVFPPPPRLVIVGAVHIAIPLVTFAKPLGFHTVVLDARSVFATRERFPHADELIIGWPPDEMVRLGLDVSTYVVILTHDDKFDIPSLQTALDSPARYVGVLGSHKTQERRLKALEELGVPQDKLQRIHSPIGLALGSVGVEEIALSIMAQVIAVRRGKA
jgi:xanthine dehydrogenase accessory factor